MTPMAGFQPSSPAGVPPGFYDRAPGRAPISAAAVTGFVSSLVICVPLATQLLGIICGVVGIVRTSGGRLRGRGLAVAAVCISPLAALVWVVVLGAAYVMVSSGVAVCRLTLPLLSADEAESAELVSELRESAFSERLKIKVDQAAVTAFVNRVGRTYGPLQGVELAEDLVTDKGRDQVLVHLIGEFRQGRQDILITLGRGRSLRAEIDDVAVGDLALMPRE